MTRPSQLLTILSLTTALLSAAPAQAGFEFVSKAAPKPAAAQPVAKPAPATPKTVPVTNLTPEEDESIVPTPIWTPRAPAPVAAIPLTPIVSNSDSFEMIDAPLLPDLEGAVISKPVDAPMRETLATQSETNLTSSAAAPAPVSNPKHADVLWDKPLAEIEKPLPLSAMTTSRDSITTETKPAPTSLAMPEPMSNEIAEPKFADIKPAAIPEPIVETILETPQAPVAVAPADDAVVEGFGSGLPMVMALRQIVPAHYRFSFGPNVDPGQRIDWQGGKKWSEIVADVTQKNGLQSEIAGNVVAIRRNGTTGMASVASNNMMEDVVMNTSILGAPATPPSAPLPPPMPVQKRTILSSTTLSDTNSRKLPIIEQAKAPTQTEPVSLLATPNDDMNDAMPVVDKSINVDNADTTLPTPAKTLPPITEETTILSEPVQSVDGFKKDDMKKPVADINTDLNTKQEWVGHSGKTLRSVLQDWSKQANVSLVWSSDFDYPLQTDIRIDGTYGEAVRTLLAGFSKAQPKPTGRLHKNAGVGAQPVLIIDTPRLING